ncbi:MAG: hypothetical protein K8R21_01865 [Leptospira sp.]|nr:hypothetical protein [Leptospira sp.]
MAVYLSTPARLLILCMLTIPAFGQAKAPPHYETATIKEGWKELLFLTQ